MIKLKIYKRLFLQSTLRTFMILTLLNLIFIHSTSAQAICGNELGNSNPVNLSSPCYTANSGSYTIPVYFHVVNNLTSFTLSDAQNIITKFNNEFNDYNIQLSFQLAQFDERDQCFSGLKHYQVNDGTVEVRKTLEENNTIAKYAELGINAGLLKSRYLNIFVWEDVLTWNSLSNSYQPSSGVAFPGEVIHVESSHFTGYFENYLTHEAGHFFNLFHIFRDNCTTSTCNNGDLIESIPNVQRLSISDPNDCSHTYCNTGLRYPVENFMGYTYACHSSFSEEQMDRISEFIPDLSLVDPQNVQRVISGPPNVYSVNTTINTNLTADIRVEDNVTLTIGGDITFTDLNILLGRNAKIYIGDGSKLTLDNSSLKSKCDDFLWNSVSVANGGELKLDNLTTIEDAEIGIHCAKGSTIDINRTSITNCHIGIQLGEGVGIFGGAPSSLDFVNIQNLSNLKILKNENMLTSTNVSVPSSAIFLNTDSNILEGDGITINDYEVGVSSMTEWVYVKGISFTDCVSGVRNLKRTKAYPYFLIEGNTFTSCDVGVDLSYVRARIIGNSMVRNGLDINLSNSLRSSIQDNVSDPSLSNQNFNIDKANRLYMANNFFISRATPSSISNSTFCTIGDDNNIFIDIDFTNNFLCRFKENTMSGVLNIEGGSTNDIMCNDFDAGSTVRNLVIQSSFNNGIAFNIVAGVEYSQNNGNQNLVKNIFDGDLETGLLLSSTATIGRQVDNGNEWIGDYIIGALHESNILEFVRKSEFVSNSSLLLTPTHSPDVLFTESAVTPNIPESCINGIGSNLLPWEDEKENEFCLDSILHSTQYDSLSQRERLALLAEIYMKYKILEKTDTLSHTSLCYEAIGDSLWGECLTTSIEKYIDLVFYQSDFDSNFHITTTTQTIGKEIEYAHTIYDSLIHLQLMSDSIVYDSLSVLFDDILLDLQSCIVDTLPSTDLVTSIGFEINDWKQLSPDTNDIIPIAETCSNDAGVAKFHSRGLLNGLDVEYDDIRCIPVENRRRESVNTRNKFFEVYPNPASDVLNIKNPFIGNSIIRIYGANGRLEWSKNIGPNTTSLDISSLNSGIYFVRLIAENENTRSTKFIKL